MSVCLGLPLPLFPSTLPSIISLSKELPRRICPIQFSCLVLVMSIKDHFSSVLFNTSSFVLCSVQLILSILLHIHISKASIGWRPPFSSSTSPLSRAYSVTLYIIALTILFLMSLFNPHFNNSFLLVNAYFPIAILFLIALWHFASLDIRLPNRWIRWPVIFLLRRLLFSYSFLLLLTCLSLLPLFCGVSFHPTFWSCLVQTIHHSMQIVLFICL